LLITLALTSAFPVMVKTLLAILQLEPEVPVCPVLEIVRFWAFVVKINKKVESKTKYDFILNFIQFDFV
jgi:hypothetical protein